MNIEGDIYKENNQIAGVVTDPYSYFLSISDSETKDFINKAMKFYDVIKESAIYYSNGRDNSFLTPDNKIIVSLIIGAINKNMQIKGIFQHHDINEKYIARLVGVNQEYYKCTNPKKIFEDIFYPFLIDLMKKNEIDSFESLFSELILYKLSESVVVSHILKSEKQPIFNDIYPIVEYKLRKRQPKYNTNVEIFTLETIKKEQEEKAILKTTDMTSKIGDYLRYQIEKGEIYIDDIDEKQIEDKKILLELFSINKFEGITIIKITKYSKIICFITIKYKDKQIEVSSESIYYNILLDILYTKIQASSLANLLTAGLEHDQLDNYEYFETDDNKQSKNFDHLKDIKEELYSYKAIDFEPNTDYKQLTKKITNQ